MARKAPLVASDSSSSSGSDSDEEEGKPDSATSQTTTTETTTTETTTTGAGKETVQLTMDAKNERAVFSRYTLMLVVQLLCVDRHSAPPTPTQH